jgi:L-Lysine epsilon oxidase N-terminal/L-lysine epsilon oxidase C-terminal domain
MAKVYKIHPGIGIARVGRSSDGYFLGPEAPGDAVISLSETGAEIPFGGYKDDAFLMRRQGARFRIFEYDDNGGDQTLVREITAADAAIEWTVKLASRKAAGVAMNTNKQDEDGADIVTPGPAANFRNQPPPGMTRDDLVATIDLTVTATGFTPNPRPMASFLGNPFYIGEARTDFAGRLVVLGGMGESKTWIDPAAQLVNFLNNPGWHDDIADGPVDAKIKLNGSQTSNDAVGAWVVVAPPDFAPAISPLTTLYDVAVQAREGSQPGTVSYPMDIEPMFQHAAGYYWVNQAGSDLWDQMREFLKKPQDLKDNSKDASSVQFRDSVRETMLEGEGRMSSYKMTKRQKNQIDLWVAGDFIPGPDNARPQPDAGQLLDRAALEHGVAGGFFPGIEAGVLLREPTLYSELGRFTRGQFNDGGSMATLQPGLLTSRMACPWQADFMQCLGAWWPAQRPDILRFTENGAAAPAGLQWDRGVRNGSPATHVSRQGMVDHFAQLGVVESVVIGGNPVFAEKGRDQLLDPVA